MKEENEKFVYTYTVPTENERREIEEIRAQYAEKQDNKSRIEELRDLHRRVNRPPLIVAVLLGVLGTLTFGLGMALVLEFGLFGWGIAVSLVGAGVLVGAYFAHKLLLRRGKKKYGARILELSESLLRGEEKE